MAIGPETNMIPGWLKLYRKLAENPIWLEKPFGKGQAWVDMLIMVNFEPAKFKSKKAQKVYTIEPGEFIRSKLELASRWGWSRGKVSRFLELLENEHMIRTSNETYHTRFKVLNWKDLQYATLDDGTPADTPRRTGDGHGTGHEIRSKEGKKVKKENKESDQRDVIRSFSAALEKKGITKNEADIKKAYAIARMFDDQDTQNKVMEWVGMLENNESVPSHRIPERVTTLYNIRQGMIGDNGLPADLIFRKAMDSTIRKQGMSPDYVKKVITTITLKWRDTGKV